MKYVFLVLFILAPIAPAIFFGQKLFYAFYKSEKKSAIIIDCHTLKSRSGSGYRRSWAPIAKTNDGDIAKGTFGHKPKKKCEDQIGNKVSVYVSSIDKEKHQINTFFQLWFRPILFILIAIIFVWAMITGYKKKHAQ